METIGEVWMTFFLNAVWQVALVTIVAAFASRILRGVTARYGYLVWTAAIVMSLLLPVLTSISAIPFDLFVSTQQPTVEREVIARAPENVPLESAVTNEPFLTIPFTIAAGIFAAYALFVLLRVIRLMKALSRTLAIARHARMAKPPEPISNALERCRGIIGRSERVEIRFSDAVPVPVTIGHRRPLIILPEQFLHETDEDVLLAAIGHELVHVHRRDYALNLALEVICLPLSFHPATTYARRRARHQRELCCDEIVATRLLNAEIYARSLLNIAGSIPALNRFAPITAVGITDAENLEARIMSLIKRTEVGSYKKILLAAAALALLGVPLAAAAFLSPDVNVNRDAIQPEAEPTIPSKEVEDEMIVREAHVKLERKLEEVRKALDDPNLPPDKREKYTVLAERLERELNDVRDIDHTEESIRETELEERSKAREKEEMGEVEDRRKEERAIEERLETLKLRQMATVTMDEAIKIALVSYPGKLVEKGIGRMGDEVIYRILISQVPGSAESTMVIVSGTDSRIIKTERVKVKEVLKEF